MLCTRRCVLVVLMLAVALAGPVWVNGTSAIAQGELVIYKDGTKLYHRPSCAVVRDVEGVLLLTRAQAEAHGYTSHPDCDPANRNAPTPSAQPKPQPPITVYIGDQKYYHRKTCAKLDAASATVKAVPLEAAAKTYWPCPDCKAPVFKKNVEPAVPGTNRRRGG
jgi:hypothetical protein